MNTTYEKSIYASENHKTHRENFNHFLQYVSESVSANKQDKEKIFQEKYSLMSIPTMKDEMLKYHNSISKARMFTNKQTILEDTLLQMHYHETLGVVKNEEFANALKNDKNFRKITITDEAQNLLSGSVLYSYDVSAKESKALRETIQLQDKRINLLTNERNELKTSVDKITTSLNNLVSNIKQKFSLTDQHITEMMTSTPKEKVAEGEKQVIKSNNKLKI